MATQTHPDMPARRRSRHELRLEQIAIWGDAAAAYGRGATVPTTTSALRAAKKSNAQPLDLELLQFDLGDVPEGEMRSGSLSMCHSRSAEVFRRSGKHGAVARASMKGRGGDMASINEQNDHVVIKRGGVLGKGSYRVERGETRGEIRGETRGSSREQSEKRQSDRRQSERRQSERRQSERRQSERRQSERRQSERRQSDKKRKEDTAAIRLKSRRESKEMREKDENDFRLSNAKLPERVDEPRGGLDWAPFRRRRSSVPILGRYTRSRSSQLPTVRPKSLRPFQSSKNPL